MMKDMSKQPREMRNMKDWRRTADGDFVTTVGQMSIKWTPEGDILEITGTVHSPAQIDLVHRRLRQLATRVVGG